jgi:O-antigen ligase
MRSALILSEIGQKLHFRLPTLWTVGLVLFLLLFLAPQTFAARPIEWLMFHFLTALAEWGFLSVLQSVSYCAFLYWLGVGILCWLFFSLLFAHFALQLFTSPVSRVIFFMVLLTGVFLLDFVFNTADAYPYDEVQWFTWAFASFFLIVLLANSVQAAIILKCLLVILAVQSLYGVSFYFSGVDQFYTPRFGNRTGGTFGDPNQFYPLCLLTIPAALALVQVQHSLRGKLFWGSIALLSFTALFLTYTRAGWLALIPALVYLAFNSHLSSEHRRVWQALMLIFSVGLLVTTLFVRTQGHLMGNTEDRSFWGRMAIWKVAIMGVSDYPLLGSGISTYSERQQQYMTPELQRFNPLNVEPKNLYLHLASEVGLVGLGAFLLLIGGYYYLYRRRVELLEPEYRAFAIGGTAALLALLVAGFVDTPILQRIRFAPSLAFLTLLACCIVLLNEAVARSEHDPQENSRRIRRFWRKGLLLGFSALTLLLIGLMPSLLLIRKALPHVEVLREEVPLKPSYTPLAKIVPVMQDAVIASEDMKFYEHTGVDWTALHRALRVNARHARFVQGGSTITMQMCRYVWLGRERTLTRKIAEIPLALYVERLYSKERILELYLNSARFGLGAEDIGTAAKVYFGQSPDRLQLHEAAFLAGVLPEPPASTAELTPEKVERCKRRALERLKNLPTGQYSAAEIQRAVNQPLIFVWERKSHAGAEP